MKKNLMYFLSTFFLAAVLIGGCSSIKPVPGTSPEKWKEIQNKIMIDKGIVQNLRESKKILISGFQVKYIYEIRKGEQSVLSKGHGVEKTRTLKWKGEIYRSLTNGLYDIFVRDLEKRGHQVVPLNDLASHPNYSELVGDKPDHEDTKDAFFKLGRCDARTDTCKDWVTYAPEGMKLISALTGVTAFSGDQFGRIGYPLGANAELQVDVTISFHWSEGNVVIDDVKLYNKLGLEEMSAFGKKNYMYNKGTGNMGAKSITGEKYADFPGFWDRVFRDKEVSADHKKFIESTMAAFSRFSDLYSALIAKKI